MNGQADLAAAAIKELLPAFHSSTEPMLQRQTPLMEGIVRRLELVGKPFELEGTLLDGSKFDWNNYRGKVVLVDFFQNSCLVCREEVPIVLQAYSAYKDQGFEVVGINLDEQPQLAAKYRKDTGFQFPTLFGDDMHAIALKYGVMTLPRAILIDQKGNVVSTVARGERLIQQLYELLGPPGGQLGQVGQLGDQPSAAAAGATSDVVPTAFDAPVQLGPPANNSASPQEAPSDTGNAAEKAVPTVPEE
jgi:thiol-disulfide isomerase/thioredoxin